MEYIIALLVAVLIGLILNRKLPQPYQFVATCYWVVLGINIVHSLIFAPYRFFRVLYDLGHLLV